MSATAVDIRAQAADLALVVEDAPGRSVEVRAVEKYSDLKTIWIHVG